MKMCKRCGFEKPLQDFGKNRLLKDGLQFYCKLCRNAMGGEEYRENPTYMKAYNRRYRTDHKEELESRRLTRIYGLTTEDLKEMLSRQNNSCAVCRTPFGDKTFEGKKKNLRPHVDHDHRLNFVRGILCSNCNTAVGLLGEDSGRIRAAANYLEAQSASLN